ncbi:hypothetical protein BGZ57DRAFT_904053 [Hyaloscypha finlandica]|nr:hypothetical protein BGZ57DRAFT_904053 [Hyaloscypha finlandica]
MVCHLRRYLVVGSTSLSWHSSVGSSDGADLGWIPCKDGNCRCVEQADDLPPRRHSGPQCNDCRYRSLFGGDGHQR